MNDGDVHASSSTQLDESGYQLVLPSGNYWCVCGIRFHDDDDDDDAQICKARPK